MPLKSFQKIIIKTTGEADYEENSGKWKFTVSVNDIEMFVREGIVNDEHNKNTAPVMQLSSIIAALEWVKDNYPYTPVEISNNYNIAVDIINGSKRCHAKHLTPYRDRAQRLLSQTRAKLI